MSVTTLIGKKSFVDIARRFHPIYRELIGSLIQTRSQNARSRKTVAKMFGTISSTHMDRAKSGMIDTTGTILTLKTTTGLALKRAREP